MVLGQPNHYWKFNENTGTTAADGGSDSAIDITGLTSTNWKTGILNSAFQPASDGFSTGSAWSAFSTSNTGSVSFWAKRDGDFSGRVCANTISGNGSIFIGQDGTNIMGIRNFNGSWHIVDQASAMDDATWYHFVGIFKDDLVQLYVNGSSAGTATPTGTINSSTFNIFSEASNGVPLTNLIVDDLRIYNFELNSTEVNEIYNSGSPSEWSAAVNYTATPSALALTTSIIGSNDMVIHVASALAMTDTLNAPTLSIADNSGWAGQSMIPFVY